MRCSTLCSCGIVKITWDGQATAHLERLAAQKSVAILLTEWRTLIKNVWDTNLQRYEPDTLGDTLRSLGQLSADNIVQRTVRQIVPGSALFKEGVRASAPDTSLLVELAGYRFHVIKAPSSSKRSPDWMKDFRWTSGSAVRLDAAAANTRAYRSQTDDPRQPSLFELRPTVDSGDANETREVFLIWAGEFGTEALTSGWLGFPSLDSARWLSVIDLWRDAGSASDPARKGTSTPSQSFDSMPTAIPRVTLKRTLGEKEKA